MDTRIHLISLLCIGWIAYTHNSGLLLQLTQFHSGDNVTLVCSAINTTINMPFTHWYMDEVRVLTSVFAGHDHGCNRNPPNYTTNNPAYRYDLFTSNDGSVSCGYLQHNITLTTTQYLHAGTVWRCEDQQFRVSNNLTLGTTDKSTTPLTDSVTTITTDSDTHGFNGTTYRTSSQLTTLANLTSIKITTAPRNDNQDDTTYIAAGTGGEIFILIIIVICVCVVRMRRKGHVTQDDTMYIAAGAGGCIIILIVIVICVGVLRRRNGKVKHNVSLAEVDAPQYDTLAHDGNTDPCYSEIKKEASRQSSINANDVYYNTVPENADYENPPMIT